MSTPRFLAMCLIISLTPTALFGATATQVSQHGITWTFSEPREVGQFVNGDWWVVGPVTITGYSPAPSGGMHGSMVNPEIGQGQAYDYRANQYNNSYLPSFPLTLSGGNSLVTATSWTDNPDYRTDYIGKNPSGSVTNIRTAAVLTVVTSAPPADAFRPPYAGTTKTIYRTSDINYDLLRHLPPANQTPGYDYEDVGYWPRDYAKTAAAQYARLFERVWILHVTDWSGRSTHPTENMPNYHREVYNVVATGAVLLLCDLDEIDKLLIPYLQIGIDSHYIITTGGGDGHSDADSSIHKWPVLFAGMLFDDAAMKSNGYRYRTEWMSYYLVDRQSTVVSAIVPAGYTYNGYTVGWRQDPGNTEHEHLDPETEWGEEYVQIGGGGSKRETYRRINSHTWPGVALAAHLTGAVAAWDHPAFFDYMDRWMTEDEYFPDRSPSVGSTTSAFVSGMWDTYRDAGYSTLLVDAGDDQDITLPETAALDGTISSSDPASVSVTWSKVSGPGAVTFDDANAVDTTASFSTDGTYVLRLSGDDGQSTDDDDVTILVRPDGYNHLPVADAGADQEVTDAGDDGSEPVTLNGSGSSDADGTIVSYEWTESSATIATGVTPLVDLAVGVHTITLEVTDDDDGTDTDTVSITVLDASAVTSTSVWQSFGLPAQTDVFTVEFDAVPNGSSIDALVGLADGVADAYADLATCIRFNTSGNIDSRDGDTYAADATVAYSTGTSYHFRMLVNIPSHVFDVYVTPDGGAQTLLADDFAFRNGTTGITTLDTWALYSYIGSATVSNMEVTQVSSNQAPVADAGADQTVTDDDDSGSELVTLDGSGSYDPDGTITSYLWTENSSQIATGPAPSVSFAVGSHTVTLTVTDDDTATDTDTVVITINEPTGNAAPTADAGPNQSVSDSDDNGSEPVTLDGSGSYDSDGTITSYLWREDSTQIATGAAPSVTLDVGVHTIELTVTDDDSATGTDTVAITVTAAPSGGGTVEETFESSATQTTFDGTADLTWSGDTSELELAAADWNGGNTFGGSSEVAARGKLDTVTVNRTVVTDVSAIFDDSDEMTWSVYASGSSTAFQSSVGVAIILTADSNSAPTIESPTQAFQGYKLEISDWGSGDAMRLYRSTAAETGWVVIHTELFGAAARVEHGWNLQVTRSAAGLWTVAYANGAKGQTPATFFTVTDTAVDLSGATWYAGMGLRCPASKSDMTGFDDFRVEAAGSGNIPPTAHAGDDQTVTDTDDSGDEPVTLDGGASSDADGTITSYLWREDSAQIATGSAPNVTLAVGVHTIELTVTDDDDASDSDTVVVTVNAYINVPPTADAGSDQTVTDTDDNGSESVTLDGSGSSDTDGSISGYVWDEGGTTVGTGSAPQVVFNVGVHTVTLTVTDDDQATDTDIVVITVEEPANVDPVADAGDDQTLTLDVGATQMTVALDGSGSYDSDGTITGYVWTESAVEIATGAQPSVTLDAAEHTITLTVTDDDAATDTDTVVITVNEAPNHTPVADAGVNRTVHDTDGNGSEVVTLDGSNSDDVDGAIVSYVWEESSQQIATGMSPDVTLDTGSHTITLTVTDDDDATDTATVTILVNIPPVADAGGDQAVTDTDDSGAEPVTLDGSGSSDSDGTISGYVWEEDATQIATGIQPNVTLAVGEHTLTLTVTDDDGATDDDTVIVTVDPPSTGGGDTLSETFESSSTQSTFDGTADLTWAGDVASFSLAAADWPSSYDFGSSSEVAIRSKASAYDEYYTIITDISSIMTTSDTMEWSVYISGASAPIQSRVTFDVVLLADSNSAATIESPTQAFQGYKLRVFSSDVDRIGLFKSTDSDAAWVEVDSDTFTDPTYANVSQGWVIHVTRSSAGLWTVAFARGSNTETPVTAFTVTDTSVDLAGDTWYAGCGYDTVDNYTGSFGFDDFAVTGVGNFPPTADAGDDQTVNDSDDSGSESVTLDGSGSYDSDGTLSSYVWKENDSQIATGSAPNASFSVGAHTVELTVTDDDGATDTDTVQITVTAYVNLAPTADAGDDQTVTDSDDNGSESVTLDGSGSSDSDGTISSYVWEEDAAQIATGAMPGVTLDVGIHSIALTVTDDDDATDSDTVTVTVNPAPPAGSGQAVETFESSYTQSTFDGTGDLTWWGDYDAFELAAADWPSGPDFGTGGEIASRSKYSASDVYNTMVTDISDIMTTGQEMAWEVFASGDSCAFQVSVRVEIVLLADSADAATIESPTQAFQGYKLSITDRGGGYDCIQLLRSTSSDSGWVVVDYEDFGVAKRVEHGWNLKVTRSSAGLWTVYYANGAKGTTPTELFSVTDTNVNLSGETWYAGVGWKAPDSKSDYAGFDDFVVTGAAANAAPAANAGSDQTAIDDDGNGTAWVYLDGSDSFDPDGLIVGYAWSEDGSPLDTGVAPAVLLEVGVHTLTLEVTDDEDATDTDTVEVTVVSPTVTGDPLWQNCALPAQTGTFTVEFDALPGGSSIDGVFGLSYGEAYAYADQAAIVRFYTNGEIEAKNGDDYMNDTTVTYSTGTYYHIRMVINVPTSTYDIYVTPEGQSEITLGGGYDFRTGQIGVGVLDTWSIRDYWAPPSVTISNLTITAW